MGGLPICHVVAPAPVGGLESVVVALAAGMARRGHEVRVLALLGPTGSSEAFQGLSGVGVELMEIRFPPRSYRSEIRRLTFELSNRPGTIAHSHGYHADLVGLRAARAAARPIVSTAHGFSGGGWKNRIYEWVDIRALARFDAVVAVSHPLGQRLADAGVPRGRLRVIPNAYQALQNLLPRVEARRILGLPAKVQIAGWVGRVSPEKGPDVFLEALALAPEWLGSVIGSGPLEANLRRRLEASGGAAGPQVRWHGAVHGAGALMTAFDAFVLSSRTEGTPIALLEAMAAGVPLVVTAVGGVPDVVTKREAVLVPPEDPAGIAQALRRIAAEPAAAQARAAAAAARLHQLFALDPWLDQYETIYTGLGHSQMTSPRPR